MRCESTPYPLTPYSHLHFYYSNKHPPRPTLLPYTTLFRSRLADPSRPRSEERHADDPDRWNESYRSRRAHSNDRDQIGRAHVELQSLRHLVCRLLLEKKKNKNINKKELKKRQPDIQIRKTR